MVKKSNSQVKIAELTADLQRLGADFENYRKRVESEKELARAAGKVGVVWQILPVLDDIERATAHLPARLKDDDWAKGVTGLTKKLDQSLAALGVSKVKANPGTPFDPELHEAVASEGDGEHEAILEVLRTGYKLGDEVIRPAMVRVIKKDK